MNKTTPEHIGLKGRKIKKTKLIDYKKTAKAAIILKGPSHRFRLEILDFLRGLNEAICVTDIYIHFRKDQSLISQHLKKLRVSGLVTTERRGKNIYYSFNEERYIHVFNALSKFSKSDKEYELNKFEELYQELDAA